MRLMVLSRLWLASSLWLIFNVGSFRFKSLVSIKKGLFGTFQPDPSRAEKLRSALLFLTEQYDQFEKDNFEKLRSTKRWNDLKKEQFILQQKIRNVIENLAVQNPTTMPLQYWGEPPNSLKVCPLEGCWKLRYTTASDAKVNGAYIFQFVNASTGIFENIIEFRDPLTDAVKSSQQVIIKSRKTSSTTILLFFSIIRIFIRRWFDDTIRYWTFTIPFPRLPLYNVLISWLNRKRPGRKPIGPHFNVVYLDEDLRIHKTGRGDYFVQSRLYDVWDPMKGWKRVTMI